jgi:hypothetical protein
VICPGHYLKPQEQNYKAQVEHVLLPGSIQIFVYFQDNDKYSLDKAHPGR